MAVTDQRWQVLVPVKPAAGAKTRLRAATGSDAAHLELVRALQADTLAAVLAAALAAGPDAEFGGGIQTIAGVCLIGQWDGWTELGAGAGKSDEGIASRGIGGAVFASGGIAGAGFASNGSTGQGIALEEFPDPGHGLNPALSAAAAHLRRRNPAAALVAVMADLPALRPADLSLVLQQGAEVRHSFVADAAGTGTTMLLAAAGEPFRPRFGVNSAADHSRQGALALPAPLRARTDVDTVHDLRDCLVLGVGTQTGRALAGVHLHRA